MHPIAFALIRNIQKLSGTALVADVFIVVGLIYIFSNEIALLGKRGVADVKLFNSKDFPLLIGSVLPAMLPSTLGPLTELQISWQLQHRRVCLRRDRADPARRGIDARAAKVPAGPDGRHDRDDAPLCGRRRARVLDLRQQDSGAWRGGG